MSRREYRDRLALERVRDTEPDPDDLRLAMLIYHLHRTGFRHDKNPKPSHYMPTLPTLKPKATDSPLTVQQQFTAWAVALGATPPPDAAGGEGGVGGEGVA